MKFNAVRNVLARNSGKYKEIWLIHHDDATHAFTVDIDGRKSGGNTSASVSPKLRSSMAKLKGKSRVSSLVRSGWNIDSTKHMKAISGERLIQLLSESLSNTLVGKDRAIARVRNYICENSDEIIPKNLNSSQQYSEWGVW